MSKKTYQFVATIKQETRSDIDLERFSDGSLYIEQGYDRIHIEAETVKEFISILLPVESKDAGEDAIEFADWIRDENYVKYFGNEGENRNKWYKAYTKPNRNYYTPSELYTLYINSKQK